MSIKRRIEWLEQEAKGQTPAVAVLTVNRKRIEMLLGVLTEPVQREQLLREIWLMEHGLWVPPIPLPKLADDRAKVMLELLRTAFSDDQPKPPTQPIPARDLEVLRERYPIPEETMEEDEL
ncbi:hypothetical protein DSCW_32740 [Desulfosarcina widdelii]|uniref:Uncharacterized protein n=1 Tax=Desulfosarcina widdelii TaxID=947919 RepID=A0A5K7ZIH6_9BACT|nr:hypothetical protein [Desulfosarcina widdelii]BBO75857.1 hypothetical protein DSCW_32740 [Desulfosarcina widdelii]